MNVSLKSARLAAMLLIGLVALAACAPASVPSAQAPTSAPTAMPATQTTTSTPSAVQATSAPTAASPTAEPTMVSPTAAQAPTLAPSTAKVSALDFRNAMRKLWEDHITFTRLYIISAAHNLPDKDATAQRLLANQADIGNAIKPYYGAAAGDKLTALLREHILGAAEVLAAAKAGDKGKVDAASAKWYQNANDIAVFLNSANPQYWPLPTLQDAMKVHLDQTLKEAVDRLGGKYTDDIKDYDAVHAHILDMADLLSNGIIAQFPDRFDTSGNAKETAFQLTMRKLWEDHITFTRLYIISVAHNLPDKDATAQRLLTNQTDIGNAVATYYETNAGTRLATLLKDHILGAADVLAAAKAGDKAKVDAASTKWYQNADDIAVFLNTANPKNWPLPVLKDAMKVHLDQTLKESVDRLGGKYADDIQDYDAVHAHILDMADLLSRGIIAQFPDKFK